MRDAPSEPMHVILTRPQNCSGCREAPQHRLTHGYQFRGSDATFCRECANEIDHWRGRFLNNFFHHEKKSFENERKVMEIT